MKYIAVGKQIKTLEINEDKLINREGYAKLYELNKDKCAKVYYEPVSIKDRKDIKTVIKKIRSLDIDCMYKIYELLYNNQNLAFSGYTRDIINGTPLSNMTPEIAEKLMSMSSEEAMELLIRLEYAKNTLSNNGIYISDDIYSGIIVHDNTFTIGNVDRYLYRPNQREKIIVENDQLINLIETMTIVRAATILNYPENDKMKVVKNCREIFGNNRNVLANKLETLSKEKTLKKTLLK